MSVIKIVIVGSLTLACFFTSCNLNMDDQKTEAHKFYIDALELLRECDAEFMLGGGFAFFYHTGIYRNTKDMDVFCKSTEYPKILKFFAEKGYQTELSDVRWLAKIFKGESYVDLIFNTVNHICTVDDSWFQHASHGTFENIPVRFVAAEEMIWCKIYVQNRERYDGADVNHLLLKCGKTLDWKRVLSRLDPHWHLLLAQILLFQFVYPADFHDIIPQWLFDELMARAHEQYDLPAPVSRVCRGPIIDQTQYNIDIKDWSYKVQTMKSV